MLTDEKAIDIVVDCIRAVSRVTHVDITGTLDDANVIDVNRVNSVVQLIVFDRKIGVPSERHRIDDRWFNGTSPNTAVNACITIVRKQSVPSPGRVVARSDSGPMDDSSVTKRQAKTAKLSTGEKLAKVPESAEKVTKRKGK